MKKSITLKRAKKEKEGHFHERIATTIDLFYHKAFKRIRGYKNQRNDLHNDWYFSHCKQLKIKSSAGFESSYEEYYTPKKITKKQRDTKFNSKNPIFHGFKLILRWESITDDKKNLLIFEYETFK